MFGLELQSAGNVFISGVKDREVAFRHDTGLMTLEGDETLTPGALSELEFVTAPCATLEQGQEAIGYAVALATALAKLAEAAGPEMSFKEGDKCAGGAWTKDCTLAINDPTFAAKPQGTVGVPLAGLRRFIENVLDADPKNKVYLDDMAKIRMLSGLDFSVLPEETKGFLTACHLFLLCATWQASQQVAIGSDGRPLVTRNGDFWRVFAFKDSIYLKCFGYRTENGVVQAFYKTATDDCRALVHRDSPKSLFQLLHRTDFCSMYHALPPAQQALLRTQPGTWPQAVWPEDWENHRTLLVFPYRADPPDNTAAGIEEYPAAGWAGDGATRQGERWWLMEHGPSLDQWWDSVVNGQPQPDGPPILKDLASPPPGLRGRNRDKLDRFPGADENKREYYGMGAFPMDCTGGTPLAVYEHRSFADHPDVKALDPPTKDKWSTIVRIFCEKFVPQP